MQSEKLIADIIMNINSAFLSFLFDIQLVSYFCLTA